MDKLVLTRNQVQFKKVMKIKESFIEKLYAKNVGLFRELTIKFNKGFNLIIGPNGCGKTSILKCIALAVNPNAANISRYGDNSMFWVDLNYFQKKYRFGVGKGWVKNYYAYRQATARGHSSPPHPDGIPSYHSRELENPNINFCPLFIGAYRKIDYIRIPGMQREQDYQTRRKTYRNNSINYLEGINLPQVKQWMINRYFGIEKRWANLERLNWEWLKEKIPKIAPKGVDFEFVEIKRDLEPIFSLNGIQCYLEELSAGYMAFLSLILSIFDWIEGINDIENDRIVKNAFGTVIIDELDVHMHPEWQYSVKDTLETIFPNLQFITTTHSPHLISTAKAGEIIILPEFSRVVNVKPSSNIYSGWTTDQILKEIMGVTSLESKLYNKLLSEALDCIDNKNITRLGEILIDIKNIAHPTDIIVKKLELKLDILKAEEI